MVQEGDVIMGKSVQAIRISVSCLMVSLLAACGGGGGSSAPPVSTSSPASGFDAGQFQPSSQFKDLCAVPRTGSNFPDRQGTTTDENNWLRSWSNELYLWYNEITDQNPRSFSTSDYFDRMKTTALTGSGAAKDRFHFTIPTAEYEALAESGIEAGYGAKFVVLSGTRPRDVRVAFVNAGSPAAAAGLVRGTRVVSVDDAIVADTSDTDALNAGLFPNGTGEVHRFEILLPDETTARTVTLTSAAISIDPVDNLKVINVAGDDVGYMHFNNHIAPAEEDLVSAFRFLRDQNVDDLVLDLRYNGGGFLDIANETAFMIAGVSARGKVFEEIRFNNKHAVTNPVTNERLQPDRFHETTQGFSGPQGVALPVLNLRRVFVLTTGRTCSASEAIINGLRGAGVEVIQIGGTTCGKPFGFYATGNCGTTYFSIQFQGVNALGFGDYPDGFGQTAGAVQTPGCQATDDFTRQLGDPDEQLLSTALAYQDTGSCPTLSQPLDASEGIAINKPGEYQTQDEGEELVEPQFPGAVLRL